MPAGRPSTYRKKYNQMVDDYLAQCQDKIGKMVKSKNEQRGYETYEHKLVVNLPTIEGFAQFINVPRRTVFDWRDEIPKFSHSLDKILNEQQKRLINSGLSGDYNSTIAKLILSSNHGMVERSDVTSKDEKLTTFADAVKQYSQSDNSRDDRKKPKKS